MYDFYNNYIKNHVLIILVIIMVIVFLTWRYYKTKESKELNQLKELEGFNYPYYINTNSGVIPDNVRLNEMGLPTEIDNHLDHLMHNNQPHFNPLYPVNQQLDYVDYPPDPLPVKTAGNTFMAKSLSPYPKLEPPLNPNKNTTNYDYHKVYTNTQGRQYYTGTENTYKQYKDTDLINPFGFSNEFNTNTANFIRPMTGMNKDNVNTIVDYNKKKEYEMVKGANQFDIGDKSFDVNMLSNYAPIVSPPYSD